MESNIGILEFSLEISAKLKSNNINTIAELWKLKRTNLKLMGFNNHQINQIMIKLQLIGLDLGSKNNINDEIKR